MPEDWDLVHTVGVKVSPKSTLKWKSLASSAVGLKTVLGVEEY